MFLPKYHYNKKHLRPKTEIPLQINKHTYNYFHNFETKVNPFIRYNHKKGLIIYIQEDKIGLLRQILQKNDIDTITYFDVMGRGKLERQSYERIVQGYRTNQTIVPDFVSRLRIELIVDDAKSKEIISLIKQDGGIKGNIFVYDVSESYEL